jgi:hypothetical protein
LPSVLVFPWGNSAADNIDTTRNQVSNYFKLLGGGNISFIEYDAAEELANKISASDLIYLTGGLTSVL